LIRPLPRHQRRRHERAARLPRRRAGVGAGLITDTAQADPWGVAGLGAGSSAQPFGYTGEQRAPVLGGAAGRWANTSLGTGCR
jgi:hypothetical protein